MKSAGVNRLYDIRSSDNRGADFIESSLLRGDGYDILFLINYPDSQANVTVTFDVEHLWKGREVVVKDFFTGEEVQLSAQGSVAVKVGPEKVKAFVMLCDRRTIGDLARWKPVYPYSPYDGGPNQ